MIENNHMATAAAMTPAKTLGSRRWVYIFIGLLIVHAGSMIAMAVIASADSFFAVEPNYYEQALNWDSQAAQAAHNQELGWSASVDVDPPPGAPGRLLRVRLVDAEGRGLDGAVVAVECFHHARSAERITGELAARGDGAYDAALPIDRPGMWEVRLNIRRGPERFTQRMQITVPAAGGGMP